MRSIVIGAHLLRDDIEPLAQAIPVGDVWLSAVEVPDDQPLGERELLVRVADIRARLLEVATFIAIRYGFAVATPEEAQRKCVSLAGAWRRILAANRTHVEMTLKVAAAAPGARPDRRDFAGGAEYLRALHGARQAASADPRFVDTAGKLLGRLTVAHRWIHRDEKSVELAMLIERNHLEAMHDAGQALRDACPDVPFLLSGPWPLEVFADDPGE